MPNPLLKPVELAIRRAFLRGLGLLGKARRHTAALAPEHLVARLGPEPSILLLRQDRLGDLLMSSFFLVALRTRFPGAHIAIVLGKNNAAGFPLLPANCEAFVYSKRFLQDMRMLRTIRKRNFDLMIDLTDKASVTSSIFLALSGAKIRLGVAKENSVVYDLTVPQFAARSRHITERVAEMLRPLGIDPETVDRSPRLNVRANHTPGRVGMNVSSRTADRSAPPAAMAEIARGILSEGVTEVLVFSAPNDRERGRKTVRLANDPHIREAPYVKEFTDLAEQIASCEYLVSVDTSVTQIASAAKVPMVLLFNAEIDQFPWTPIGVPFEIHRQRPNLESLEPQPVLALFKKLMVQSATSIVAQPKIANS
ncbi:MAG: glycosyltransferase family 9 protein [Bacteroidota bacterium]|nr:glycosyltransferase family 9 protein [Bacteroidota bacterium]MDP4232263.1 glycosyltransferase family 9 protein [Bacteroidota bacterium]MDP4242665.1 glycosyltransferase family 9 protein [Bacteroidota bacterium]MDP4286773.1 glycosyltransferase family 9 protein [Bacteroidota bacterium]